MCRMLPKISNYKISYRTFQHLKTAIHKLKNEDVKFGKNFAVIRASGFVYTLNYSGYINITKIAHLLDAEKAITALHELIQIPKNCTGFNVDNITASGNFGCRVRIVDLKYFFDSNQNLGKFCFRPSSFCGANIKYPSFGTIIIFDTGSYTIVGSKTSDQVNQVYHETRKILDSIRCA